MSIGAECNGSSWFSTLIYVFALASGIVQKTPVTSEPATSEWKKFSCPPVKAGDLALLMAQSDLLE